MRNMGDEQPEREADPHSSFRLEISLAVGYSRKRTTLGGAFEGHVTTMALLIGGIVLVIVFADFVFRLFGIRMLGG